MLALSVTGSLAASSSQQPVEADVDIGYELLFTTHNKTYPEHCEPFALSACGPPPP